MLVGGVFQPSSPNQFGYESKEMKMKVKVKGLDVSADRLECNIALPNETYPPNEDGTISLWKYQTCGSVLNPLPTIYIPEVVKYRTISDDNKENQGHCCATANENQCDFLRARGCTNCIFDKTNFHLFHQLIKNDE